MGSFDTVRDIRSFRNCRDEPVPRKVMGKLLEAGRNAPSPANVQSTEFVVVEDDETLEMIEKAAGDDRVTDAPSAVVIVADIARMERRVGSEKAREFAASEAAIAVQNMRLVAREEGLASVWISGVDEESLSMKLDVPEGKTAISVVLLGYTDNPVPPENKFGLNQIAFYDRYDSQWESFFDTVEWKGLDEERKVFQKKSRGIVKRLRDWTRKNL